MNSLLNKQNVPGAVIEVCVKLNQAGGQAWLVGGCVRDLVLGLKPKDWDIEVYALDSDAVLTVLRLLGRCELVGKRFGVIKLWLGGFEIDVALPRTEKKVGAGHKGFDVLPDPYLSPEQASLRRDFTINAMMFNPLEGTLQDFHQGLEDLKNKRLHSVSSAFVEDPLRPLRAMQFAARFRLRLSKATVVFCRQLCDEAQSLPGSRVWQEWLKWSGAEYPSYGLKALSDMGWLACYPELDVLRGCKQDQHWHPEGDVWTHTGYVVDAAAEQAKQSGLEGDEYTIFLFAALCHDFGKPKATVIDEQGQVSGPQHGMAGEVPTRNFLKSISAPQKVMMHVLPLVREHVAHFETNLSANAVKRLAFKLEPASIYLWEKLAEADASGCPPLSPRRPALKWLEMAQSLQVKHQKEKPIVTGKFLLACGQNPSKQMGALINEAYEAQLDGFISDDKTAYSWLKKYDIARAAK